MREIRQSGSEGGGGGTTVAPYPYYRPKDASHSQPAHIEVLRHQQ